MDATIVPINPPTKTKDTTSDASEMVIGPDSSGVWLDVSKMKFGPDQPIRIPWYK